jgi:SAM-dependent methyltransferase
MSEAGGFYDTTYGDFVEQARAAVRAETFGEDLGQNDWMTAEEWRYLLGWLQLPAGAALLDVGCGSGGPVLYAAQRLGVRVCGVDSNASAIEAAVSVAAHGQVQARFEVADASRPLPFADGEFDALVCIDAINHLAGRERVLADWRRVVRPGGQILFTDPIIVTGLLTSEEIAARSAIGFFVFSLLELDRALIRAAGLELVREEDLTGGVANVSRRWRGARERYREQLVAAEGEHAFEDFQRFFDVVYDLSSQRRLSRYVFLALRPA